MYAKSGISRDMLDLILEFSKTRSLAFVYWITCILAIWLLFWEDVCLEMWQCLQETTFWYFRLGSLPEFISWHTLPIHLWRQGLVWDGFHACGQAWGSFLQESATSATGLDGWQTFGKSSSLRRTACQRLPLALPQGFLDYPFPYFWMISAKEGLWARNFSEIECRIVAYH